MLKQSGVLSYRLGESPVEMLTGTLAFGRMSYLDLLEAIYLLPHFGSVLTDG